MFQNRKLSNSELKNYADLISDTYMVQIRAGKFYVGIITDLVGDEETPKVLYITYSFAGWIELVWIHFYDKDALPTIKADFLNYLIRVERARRGEGIKGIFCEIHTDEVEDTDSLRHMLMMSGFEIRVTVDNIYDLTLGQVGERQFLKKVADALKCISVDSASDELKEKLDYMIREDARPVPVGTYVNWDEFMPDLSMICLKKDDPYGLLLFSMKRDNLVIDCAYTCDKLALPAMLGTAITVAEEKYGPGQHVLVPVVLDKTGVLVTRLAPEAKRGEFIEAIQWF